MTNFYIQSIRHNVKLDMITFVKRHLSVKDVENTA